MKIIWLFCYIFAPMREKKIWVLLDERAGNASQSLGVAEALGWSFETKKIEFTPLIKLPNFLINRTSFGIANPAELQPPWPDIVIATARRLAAVATYIKTKNPQTFLAQIQWPTFPAWDFDLIAAPLHDRAKDAANVFHTIGAPHRVTDELLKQEADKWRAHLAEFPAPRFAVLIGGSSHRKGFDAKHAKKLAELASTAAKSSGGSLLITTSRRTSAEMVSTLTANLDCKYFLHDWREGAPTAGENPYYGFLGLSDAIIATGDSVSMCSEAAATGKPLYIYSSGDFTTGKYRKFHRALYERRLAKSLEEINSGLFTPPGKLNDSLAVAAEIKRRILL